MLSTHTPQIPTYTRALNETCRFTFQHPEPTPKYSRPHQACRFRASMFHLFAGVKRKLQNVQHLQSTHSAFAAILEDGSVVTWGDKRAGGNSSSVKKRLKKLGCLGQNPALKAQKYPKV